VTYLHAGNCCYSLFNIAKPCLGFDLSECFLAIAISTACTWQPATVSRCGMIYLEPSTLGWRPMLKSWANTLPQPLQTEEHLNVVFAMFEWLVDPCFTFVKKSCKVCINHGYVCVFSIDIKE